MSLLFFSSPVIVDVGCKYVYVYVNESGQEEEEEKKINHI